MSEAKHTPGPWSVAKPEHPDSGQIDDRLIYAVADGKWLHVAESYQYQNNDNRDPNGAALANASLIAAAPDLLEACEALIHANQRDDPAVGGLATILAVDLAATAIAKTKRGER